MENWFGQVQIKVDEKGRLSLPSSAVELFKAREVVLSVGVFQKKPYLNLLSCEDWKEKIEGLGAFSDKDPKLKAYKRFLLSGSAKLNLDKQNRIVVPDFQRNLIKLKSGAVVVNLENKLELWSSDVWQEVSSSFVQDFEGLEDWANGFEETEAEVNNELKSVA